MEIQYLRLAAFWGIYPVKIPEKAIQIKVMG